jgi:hypothetical protein
MAGTIRVVTYGELWAVKREGIDEPLSVHHTEAQAEVAGRTRARADKSRFELLDQSGKVRDSHDYCAG